MNLVTYFPRALDIPLENPFVNLLKTIARIFVGRGHKNTIKLIKICLYTSLLHFYDLDFFFLGKGG